MPMIRYSYTQIRHILAEQEMYLERIWRYKERVTHYNVRDYRGNIVSENVTLNNIRYRFTQLGYPEDYDPVPLKGKRKKGGRNEGGRN